MEGFLHRDLVAAEVNSDLGREGPGTGWSIHAPRFRVRDGAG